MTDVSPLVAFLAGLLSFLSPCVLPLVPGYVSLMSGVSVEKLKAGESGAARAVAGRALLFILGFSVVFVGMGASASAVGGFLNQHRAVLYKLAGAIIILFGLFLLGLLKLDFLYREKRYHGGVGAGPVGTFLLGLAFAFGWTPCIGPILGALLLLAATKDTVAQGVFLLAVYSLGLGLPFLLTALGLNQFLGFYQGFRRHLQWVERGAGVLLIAVGLLVATNQLTWLNSYFAAFFARFNLEFTLAPPKAGLAGDLGQPAGGTVPNLREGAAGDPSTSLGASRKPAPAGLGLRRADGSAFELSAWKGKVVVVNFWATWCLPCKVEIPFFNRTYQAYRERGVEFVGISVDDGGWKDIEEFKKETPIDYLVALDKEKKAAEAFEGVVGLPVTVFLDREGRIAYTHIGITDIDTLREHIEALL